MKGQPETDGARAETRAATGDVLIYSGCAVAAFGVRVIASIPLQREWALLAVGPYCGAAAIAAILAARRAGLRARALLAVAAFLGAAVLPTTVEITWRAHSGPGFHAQSEVIITEEAARATVHGHHPYAATYLSGPLAARPLGTKTHFPYLPAMLLFGLPRALGGDHPVTDGRIWFGAAALVVFGLALGAWRAPPARRLRAFQMLLILPTGALLMAGGGDDLPVVALMLLSLALLEHEREREAAPEPRTGPLLAAGAAAGLAAATKQTAWLLLPFLLAAAWSQWGRRYAAILAASAGLVASTIVLPFVVWNPGAFVEDALRFPLGLGHQPTAADTPTLGRALIQAFPSAKGLLTALLVAIIAAAVAGLLLFRSPVVPAGAAFRAGMAFAVALTLAPAARLGYLIYPINLLAWSWLLRARSPAASPWRRVEPAALGSTRPGYSGTT
jgi:hypothetical protein